MREGHDIPHNLATHGAAIEVADALDIGANGTDPMILRAALINALQRIDRLETLLHRHGLHV